MHGGDRRAVIKKGIPFDSHAHDNGKKEKKARGKS